MDFSKISKKLRNGDYVIPNDTITDIRLIFGNAKAYNSRGTMVGHYIIITSLYFTSKWVTYQCEACEVCEGER